MTKEPNRMDRFVDEKCKDWGDGILPSGGDCTLPSPS